MATVTIGTANPATIANQLRTHLNKELIDGANKELFYNRFVSKNKQPKQMGEKTFRFFIRRDADASRVSTLTEGTPLSTYTEIEESYVDVTAAQFGEVMKITDLAADNTLWDYAARAKDEFAQDAQLKWDDVIGSAVIAGLLNSDAAGVELFSGVAETGDTSADYTSLYAVTAANGKITEADFIHAYTQLIRNGAPMINGGFKCIMPAEVSFDMLQDTTLRGLLDRQSKAGFSGSIGSIYNTDILVTNNPIVEGATYGTRSTAGKNIYSTHFFGGDAFGAVSWSAGKGNSAWMAAPQFMVSEGTSASDPLGQLKFVGFKAANAATILRAKNNVILRSKSSRFSTN